MTAKEYLFQAKNLDDYIDAKTAEAAQLRSRIMRLQGIRYDGVHVSGGAKHDFTDTIDSLIRLEQYIDAQVDKLVGLRKEIGDQISRIGETCYLLSLIVQIRSFRMGLITQDELFHSQKELEKQLEKYYQHTEIFDKHINIRNHYSYVLTEAVKSGCPVCRKLVGIFDGLEKEDI